VRGTSPSPMQKGSGGDDNGRAVRMFDGGPVLHDGTDVHHVFPVLVDGAAQQADECLVGYDLLGDGVGKKTGVDERCRSLYDRWCFYASTWIAEQALAISTGACRIAKGSTANTRVPITASNQSKGENPCRIFPFIYLAILTHLRNHKAYSGNSPGRNKFAFVIRLPTRPRSKSQLCGLNPKFNHIPHSLHLDSPSQYPPFHERDIRVADDDVVKKFDAEQFPALLEPSGDLDVLPTRRRVEGRVVVDQDDRRCR